MRALKLSFVIMKTHSSHNLSANTHACWHTSVIDHLFRLWPSLRIMKHCAMYNPFGISNCKPLISVVSKQSKGTEKARSTYFEFLLKKLGVKK